LIDGTALLTPRLPAEKLPEYAEEIDGVPVFAEEIQ